MRLISTTLATLFALAAMSAPAFAGDETTQGGKGQGHDKGHHPNADKLAKFDTNHDGKLDESERAAARSALAARLKEKHPELFAKIDTDGDGTISESEMKAARAKLEELRAKHGEHPGNTSGHRGNTQK